MVDLRAPVYERIRDSKRKQILSNRHRAALSKIGSAFPSLLSDVGFEDDTPQEVASESYNPLLGLQEHSDAQQNSQNAARSHILCQLVLHSDDLIAEEEKLELQQKNTHRLQADYDKNPAQPGLAMRLDRMVEEVSIRQGKITQMRRDLLTLINQDEDLETGPEPSPATLAYRQFFRDAAREGLLKLADTLPDVTDQDYNLPIETHNAPKTTYSANNASKPGQNLDFFSNAPFKNG